MEIDMKSCVFLQYIPDYQDEKLEPGLQKKVGIHLKSCASCRSLLLETEVLVRALHSAPRPDPGKAWMRRYHRELDARLRTAAAVKRPALQDTGKGWRLFLSPRPAVMAAGAAALLLIGILTGRFILPRSSGGIMSPQVIFFSTGPSADRQLTDFVTESEIWMLAVVNYVPEEDSSSATLVLNREAAEALLRRSLIIEKKGIEPDREDLYQFVQGMQMLLLETINSDVDVIRLVSESRQAILEMRLLDRSRLLRRAMQESGLSGA